MDLLNALLDLVDAISAGVAVAMFWHTWVVPPTSGPLPPPKQRSEPAELERFVRTASLIQPTSHRLT
jgi:hypothetical protein